MSELWGTRRLMEEAKKGGRPVSQEYLQRLCRDEVIRNAQKPARDWLIPVDEAKRWLRQWLNES